MGKKKGFVIAGGVIVVAAVAALIGFNVMGGKKKEVVAEVPPAVTVEKPALRTIELGSELIGTIEPDSIVYVTPKGAGEITAVNFQTGDTVRAISSVSSTRNRWRQPGFRWKRPVFRMRMRRAI